MAALEVVGLHKRYGRVHALRGVSLALEPGEILGYLGPNGAGKTTTLRIILGLARADRGSVSLLGQPPSRPASRERIGYLPGELRLHGGMTGHALLDHFARFRPSRPPVLRERLLAALDLGEPDLARRVKWLSHGTKQKVGLVIAMQHDPDVVLLDEPTNGLDPLVQRGFRDLLRELAARGRAILFSSHVLSEVEELCGRVAVLRGGELLAVESIEVLRGRLVRRLEVRFRGPVPADLGALAGVTRAEVAGSSATLWLQGDVNPLLRRLAACDVGHLVFPEPQLEDVFLDLYRGRGGPA